MKRLTVIFVLMLIAGTACCQADQTFYKPIYANAGIYFLDGTFLNTAITGGSVTWDQVLNKPLLFPPALHDHNLLYKPISWHETWLDLQSKPATFPPSAHLTAWIDVTGKPVEIELIDELPLLAYLPLPQKTTAEISATVVPAGTIAMIWDKTLGVIKIYDGSKWKIIITNN